jgi:hypothetical protein
LAVARAKASEDMALIAQQSAKSPKISARTRIGCSTLPLRWSPKTASYGSTGSKTMA